jgi:hypothetical protein
MAKFIAGFVSDYCDLRNRNTLTPLDRRGSGASVSKRHC